MFFLKLVPCFSKKKAKQNESNGEESVKLIEIDPTDKPKSSKSIPKRMNINSNKPLVVVDSRNYKLGFIDLHKEPMNSNVSTKNRMKSNVSTKNRMKSSVPTKNRMKSNVSNRKLIDSEPKRSTVFLDSILRPRRFGRTFGYNLSIKKRRVICITLSAIDEFDEIVYIYCEKYRKSTQFGNKNSNQFRMGKSRSLPELKTLARMKRSSEQKRNHLYSFKNSHRVKFNETILKKPSNQVKSIERRELSNNQNNGQVKSIERRELLNNHNNQVKSNETTLKKQPSESNQVRSNETTLKKQTSKSNQIRSNETTSNKQPSNQVKSNEKMKLLNDQNN